MKNKNMMSSNVSLIKRNEGDNMVQQTRRRSPKMQALQKKMVVVFGCN
jgi:hypothetical protein